MWLLTLVPVTLMLAGVLIPERVLERHSARSRTAVTRLAGLNAVLSFCLLVRVVWHGSFSLRLLTGMDKRFDATSMLIDGVSAVMLVLVAFVGWIICHFSIRYLDGERRQASYFRWVGVSIAAVSIVVVAGNLLMTIAALLLTSLALHQLLVHYADRQIAAQAAGLKFFFSRCGDLALLGAALLLFDSFQTFQLAELFARANEVRNSAEAAGPEVAVACWLIALCAILKSAQFPFHSWLPQTMEAPTPVSALMHAGIVNAGGFLLIRMGPILSLNSSAMFFVAAIGLLTACLAAVVMLTQTSVKQSLAWSTIAQMGFMILQCGLGAYSAAMLHIVAHSIYKAHAFLGSGGVIAESQQMSGVAVNKLTPFAAGFRAAIVFGSLVAVFLLMDSILGIQLATKPGGYVLSSVLLIGLSQWLYVATRTKQLNFPLAVLVAGVLLTSYLISFSLIDGIVRDGVGMPIAGQFGVWATPTAVLSFVAVFLLDVLVRDTTANPIWLQRLYIHSSNGFYVDVLWRRLGQIMST